MNKEKYNQITGDAYRDYFSKTENITLETLHTPYQDIYLYGTLSGTISNAKFRPYTKEEFINKCKTDTELSEKWGLKIEERELSLAEMIKLAKYKNAEELIKTRKENIQQISERLLNDNIPTKLITVEYKKEGLVSGL